MSDAVESIFGSIIADRGASNFDATQLQIARRVAQMLADDGRSRIRSQQIDRRGICDARQADGYCCRDRAVEA
jgi:hypothetical protein